MHGHITKYSDKLGYGVIKADNGQKYRFAKTEVQNLNGRLIGHDVDFLLNSAKAKDVILLTGTPWSVFASNTSSNS
ncbi:MAG: hypothetical protein AAFO75_03665 [Pseudomonadota bacterium]